MLGTEDAMLKGTGKRQATLIEQDLEGSGRGLIEVFSRHLPGRSEEKHVTISGVLAEIRNEYIPNTSLERYCWTKTFDDLNCEVRVTIHSILRAVPCGPRGRL
jgi:hypothetical protein